MIPSPMEPLVSLTIRNKKPWFNPGEVLDCEYQIDAIGPRMIQAIEASVLWSTTGKGDADLGVHYFERRLPQDHPDKDLRELHRFQTVCPPSPLSYEGELLKIRWCVRVRVFPIRGKEILFELPFQLGCVPAVTESQDGNTQPAEEASQTSQTS